MNALRIRGLALAILGLVLTAAASPAQERLAIVAKRIITGGAADLPGGVMLIENGRIKAIGSDLRIPEGYRVLDRKHAVIAPGLIDLASAAGAPNDLVEAEVAVERRACAADAVDLEHRDFALLARHGVTTAVVLPGDRSVIAGQGCAIKTGELGRHLVRRGLLRLNLATSVLSRTRFPASYADALTMLQAVLAAAEEGKEVEQFNAFAAGRLPGLVHVDDAYQIRDAIALRERFGLDLALLGAEDLQRALPDVTAKGLTVALAAPRWTDNRRIRDLAGRAEAAGWRVAFFAETPRRHPDVLRQGAIVAARGGLSRGAAIAAVTAEAARTAGIGDRVGSLAVGHDADFIVLDGDLLDARSRLHETWIEGRRVYRAPRMGAQR